MLQEFSFDYVDFKVEVEELGNTVFTADEKEYLDFNGQILKDARVFEVNEIKITYAIFSFIHFFCACYNYVRNKSDFNYAIQVAQRQRKVIGIKASLKNKPMAGLSPKAGAPAAEDGHMLIPNTEEDSDVEDLEYATKKWQPEDDAFSTEESHTLMSNRVANKPSSAPQLPSSSLLPWNFSTFGNMSLQRPAKLYLTTLPPMFPRIAKHAMKAQESNGVCINCSTKWTVQVYEVREIGYLNLKYELLPGDSGIIPIVPDSIWHISAREASSVRVPHQSETDVCNMTFACNEDLLNEHKKLSLLWLPGLSISLSHQFKERRKSGAPGRRDSNKEEVKRTSLSAGELRRTSANSEEKGNVYSSKSLLYPFQLQILDSSF